MTSTFNTWCSLDSIVLRDDQLVARFVPDHFDPNIDKPVIAFVIAKPIYAEESINALSKFRTDFVVEIIATPASVSVWGEYDETPTTITGEVVSCQNEAYSHQELLSLANSMLVTNRHFQDELHNLRSNLNDTEVFIKELCQRAQAKKSMTNKTTVTEDAQLDVLTRVLNRLKSF